jgi:c(7)-type cytochrome triheme protein
MRARFSTPRSRIALLAIIAVVVLLLLGAGWLFFGRAAAAPAQPINFPHVLMVQAGVTCLFCHADAQRSFAAGIPTVEKCMGCHSIIAKDRPDIIKLTNEYWVPQKPVPWQKVNQLPRFVHFSHQPHLAAGLNCERCHGDVGHMRQTTQVVTMDMGWCITCHSSQPAGDQLKNCEVCHY